MTYFIFVKQILVFYNGVLCYKKNSSPRPNYQDLNINILKKKIFQSLYSGKCWSRNETQCYCQWPSQSHGDRRPMTASAPLLQQELVACRRFSHCLFNWKFTTVSGLLSCLLRVCYQKGTAETMSNRISSGWI